MNKEATMLSSNDTPGFIEKAKNGEGELIGGSRYIEDPEHRFPIRVDYLDTDSPHACYVPFVGY